MSNIPEGYHEQKFEMLVDVLDPNHGDRKIEGESPTYRASHHQLIVVEKRGCFIGVDCDHTHPLETHHQYIEWYQANGVDFGPGSQLRADHPDFDWPAFDAAGGKAELFLDSCYNLMPLCKKHHTGKDHGIHNLPHGVWLYQKYRKPGELFAPDEVK